jgi:hypothetical protein
MSVVVNTRSILFSFVAVASMVSCANNEPKRRERVAPAVTDSTLPWNRPPKWEGNARYGQQMPGSR